MQKIIHHPMKMSNLINVIVYRIIDSVQKQVRKSFDINNDYLRATFNILSEPRINIDSTSSCNCHYPTYVNACRNFQSSSSLSGSLSRTDPVNNFDEKAKTHSYFPPSCLKHSPSLRIHFDDTA